MLLHLDPSSGLPLYVQIAAAVRRAVADGDVAVGDRLPAARDLAQSLDVNMHTVLRAYQDLREEGVIELRRGRGAIVREGAGQVAAVQQMAASLAAEAAKRGMTQAEVIELLKKEFK